MSMTMREAFGHIRRIRDYFVKVDRIHHRHMIDAVELAMRAMEREMQSETAASLHSGDLISRSALLRDARRLFDDDVRGYINAVEVAAINIAPAVDAAPKWISVEDSLPEPFEDVLCYEADNGMEVMPGKWVREQYYEGYYKIRWMRLPELPTMEESAKNGM